MAGAAAAHLGARASQRARRRQAPRPARRRRPPRRGAPGTTRQRNPRGLCDIDCPRLAGAYLGELADNLTDTDSPPEPRRLGRTLSRWHTPIVNWHRARVSNGPTEAINNLIKRVKRAAFGFRRFAHYRIRALLYAGRPNWALLATVTPR